MKTVTITNSSSESITLRVMNVGEYGSIDLIQGDAAEYPFDIRMELVITEVEEK